MLNPNPLTERYHRHSTSHTVTAGWYRVRSYAPFLVLTASIVLLSGCRFFGGAEPTRTPIPTFTPTPILVVLPAGAVEAGSEPPQSDAGSVAQTQPQVVEPQVVVADTPAPTNTPSPPPSPTAEPTITPTSTPEATPTLMPTSTPTPAPAYAFDLEAAEKFPTESLASDVVRIWLYAYSPGDFGLADYGLRISNNGVELESDSLSQGGIPQVTRQKPGPYTRFTNLSVIIVEAPEGEWEVQLVDADDRPMGPVARFEMTAGDDDRELYVRYRLGSE